MHGISSTEKNKLIGLIFLDILVTDRHTYTHKHKVRNVAQQTFVNFLFELGHTEMLEVWPLSFRRP